MKLWGDTIGYVSVNQYYLNELGARLPYQRCQHMRTKNKRCKNNGRPLCYAMRKNNSVYIGGHYFYCHNHAGRYEKEICNMEDFEKHISKFNVCLLCIKYNRTVTTTAKSLIKNTTLPLDLIIMIMNYLFPICFTINFKKN